MRRRVLIAILSVTTVAIVLFGTPLAVVTNRMLNDDATLRIERQAILASRAVPSDFSTGEDPVELPRTSDGVVLALYDMQGRLIAGSGPPVADRTTERALRGKVADLVTGSARIVAVPVAIDEGVVGAIRAEQSTVAEGARTRQLVGLLGGLALLVLGIGALMGYVVAGRLAQPVLNIRDAAVQLGDGNFDIDVPHSGVQELDQAARAMTVTARRLDDLINRERMFSADVSHQLRTPLAGLRAAIEAELTFPRPDSTDVLREAIIDIDRLERTISELLAIARLSTTIDAAVSLPDLLDQVEADWRGPFARVGRTFTVAPTVSTPSVRGNAAMLRHAIDILIDNALRHGDGEVRLDHTVHENSVILIITDEGAGFSTLAPTSNEPSAVPADPPAGGLGLPLAERLIGLMSGRIIVTRSAPHPKIDVILPRSDSSQPIGTNL